MPYLANHQAHLTLSQWDDYQTEAKLNLLISQIVVSIPEGTVSCHMIIDFIEHVDTNREQMPDRHQLV